MLTACLIQAFSLASHTHTHVSVALRNILQPGDELVRYRSDEVTNVL